MTADPIFRTSDSIRTGVTNPISDPERTLFMTRTRIAQILELRPTLYGNSDDTIQQGSPSTRKRGRRASGLITRVEDHLAFGQPSSKSGNQAGSPASEGAPGASATGRCSVQLWETRQVRLLKRARRRTDLARLEQLESRALLAFSTLGFSLPDLDDHRPGRAEGGVGRRAGRLGDSSEHRRQHDHRAAVAAADHLRRRPRARRTARPARPMRPTRRSLS